MTRSHRYKVNVAWTGNTGSGTLSYRSYERKHEISVDGRESTIPGSSERLFRGESSRWNPEELLVASISACHQLWYLHLCAVSGIVVQKYVDHAEGFMEENDDGSGQFGRVVLRPEVTVAPGSDVDKALELHKKARSMCFIASSVNFPVEHDPKIVTE